MKKLLFTALFALVGTLVFAQQTENRAPVKFKETKYNFGTIPQGIPAFTTFTFSNTSKKPLVIANVQSSCGCTTPEFGKEPILPGKSAVIKAGYNAASLGNFKRTLSVTFVGFTTPEVLTIEGIVEAKK